MLAITVQHQGVDVSRAHKVADIICWRSLEGKPCLRPDQSANAVSLSRRVILIPILPAARTPRKGDKAACGSVGACLDSKEVLWEALVEHCKQLGTALSSIGIESSVDDSNKSTPGAKFNYWEEAGAVLRVEIGKQELTTQTACLAIHPIWRKTACHVLAGQQGVIPAETADCKHKVPDSPAVLRLKGLTTSQLLAACNAMIEAVQQSIPKASGPTACQNIEDSDSNCSTAKCSSSDHEVCAAVRNAVAAPLPPSKPHALCRKLHLWPGCNQLKDIWYGPSGLLSMLQGRRTVSELHDSDQPEDSQPQTHSPPAVVCASHVRHMVGTAKPCHCQLGHVSQQQLQCEVESRYRVERQGTVTGWKRLETTPAQPSPATTQQLNASSGSDIIACGTGPNTQVDDSSDHEASSLQALAGEGADLGSDAAKAVDDQQQQHQQQQQQQQQRPGGHYDYGSRLSGPTLFISGIPQWLTLRQAKDALHTAISALDLGPFKVRVSKAVSNVTRGWAKLYVVDQAAADMALNKLNGMQLEIADDGGNHDDAVAHDSHPVQVPTSGSQTSTTTVSTAGTSQQHCFQVWVSPSCGRLDALYPHIHDARIRSRLRVDSVAAYSATDSVTAFTQAQLIACIAHVLRPAHGGSTANSLVTNTQPMQPSIPTVPGLAVDATACAGGNTTALAQCFQSVTAVELDGERAADLIHNLQLQGAMPPPPPPLLSSSSLKATSTPCAGAADQNQPNKSDIQHTASDDSLHNLSGSAELSTSDRVHVLCGDYTQLWCHLPAAAAVLIDPPWGGPDYQQDTVSVQAGGCSHDGGGMVAQDVTGVSDCQQQNIDGSHMNGVSMFQQRKLAACTCGTGLKLPGSHARCPQGPGLMLGHTSICALTGALLGSGKAQVVSLKLPACTIPSHRRLADYVADHAAVVFNDMAGQPDELGLGRDANSAAVGYVSDSIQVWAARAQFGRTSILLFARADTCRPTLVEELKKALQAWSAREHVLCNCLGVFSEASY